MTCTPPQKADQKPVDRPDSDSGRHAHASIQIWRPSPTASARQRPFTPSGAVFAQPR